MTGVQTCALPISGKPLEIDGLLAGTLEIARKAGVRAPYTESLFGLIKARATSTGQYGV